MVMFCVIDALLMFQKEMKISGNLLEIGCYKGKTAVILGLNLVAQVLIH